VFIVVRLFLVIIRMMGVEMFVVCMSWYSEWVGVSLCCLLMRMMLVGGVLMSVDVLVGRMCIWWVSRVRVGSILLLGVRLLVSSSSFVMGGFFFWCGMGWVV